MQFNRLVVLLPSQSLEDLSLRRSAAEAQQLLAAWTALWHPALIQAAQSVPSWCRAEAPPDDPAGQIIVVPPCCRGLLPQDWLQRMTDAGAAVIHDLSDREEITSLALGWLDGPSAIEPELVADFQALGLCYLLVELLTRQLRYMSNLDEGTLQTRSLDAAKAAAEGDRETARSQLHSAFDVLNESREYFYPVEAYLADLTLVAPGTAGEALRKELAGPGLVNLLLSAETLQTLAREEPETVSAMAEAVAAGRAAVIGGELCERPLPLLPPEVIADQLRQGVEVYQEILGTRPKVFGRRRFGLTPLLPQLLKSQGFQGCLHFTLDDGRFPTGNQSRIRWQGLDGSTLEALARVPTDGSSAETFLRLPERLGDVLDLDHSATMIFAHWPGQASPWYRDLQRLASFGPVLGTFVSIAQQFEHSGSTGQAVEYAADQYRSPYLRQAVAARQRDPLSRWRRFGHRWATLQALQTFRTLASVVTGSPWTRADVEALRRQIESALECDTDDTSELDQRLDEAAQAVARDLAAALGSESAEGSGRLALNPACWSRKWLVARQTAEGAEGVPTGEAVPEARVPTLDVPGLGFAWHSPEPPAAQPGARRSWWSRSKKSAPPMAEGNVLRNEFFEITFDPTTGAIRSMVDFAGRGNRLAQQIALRTSESDTLPEDWDGAPTTRTWYSIMAAEALEVVTPGPDYGEIRVRGRLCDPYGRRVAGFVQTTRLERGSRLLDLHIELDPEMQPDPEPWKSYYCARFAWDDESAELRRGLHGVARPASSTCLESTQFVEIRSGSASTAILTDGLPYHRRQGYRMLDTLLIVQGETARRFRLGVGFDLPHLPAAAQDFLTPQFVLPGASQPPSSTGWLFHLDARNVIASDWQPVVESGQVAGFRVALLETEGRRATMSLRCFRTPGRAWKLAATAEAQTELPIEEDRVRVPIGPYEYSRIECRW